MKPYWTDGQVTLHLGDCLDILPSLAENSVDAVVCDPPYGLTELPTETVLQAIAAWLAGDRTHVPDGKGFMGREWDRFVPPPGAWDECMRVLKPGGHLLAFAGPRTVDLMTLSIRIAGFEIRDSIDWLFSQGFPKSLNVAKAIASGTGRPEDIRRLEMGEDYVPSGRGRVNYDHGSGSVMNGGGTVVPLTDDAAQWEGWGTALKPAHEPIVVARKPLAGTVAANIRAHGTGALNIDGCRVAAAQDYRDKCASVVGLDSNHNGDAYGEWTGIRQDSAHDAGRWPPNVLLDESMAGELDRQSGVTKSPMPYEYNGKQETTRSAYSRGLGYGLHSGEYGDSGGASRCFPVFHYQAKASSAERPRLPDGTAWPTVKPLPLIRWLVRLVTPPGGLVLDLFAGTGTTAEACIVEGFDCVLIDREQAAVDLIRTRLRKDIQPTMFGSEVVA